MQKFLLLVLALVSTTQFGCYSLNGISIDPNARTFSVELFENKAELVEPVFARNFSEKLKEKVRNSTRLNQDDRNPDILFSGIVTQFYISPEAPQPGANVGFNRLKVTVKIEFENKKNEKGNWSQSFSDFADFGANENYNTVKNDKMDEVIKNLIEKIFNEAFAKNW